ncbi:MAG: hypothetical protein KGL52_00435 [Rhodospirillales bacterium]|jgi:hypothetical protein|nr:hypothetical protein [Rhodospirillales bacterium]
MKRNGTTTPTPLWAFGLVLAVGVTALGMMRLAQAARSWGPGVGEIVSFAQPRPPLAPTVRFTVTRLDAGGPTTCTLDSTTMARSHGSLIVEAVAPGMTRGYRAHWSGGPTATGGGDCGAQANLALSGADLGSLASAAGGFGADHRSMLPLLGNAL